MMTHRSGASKVSPIAVAKDDQRSPRNARLLYCHDVKEDNECGTTMHEMSGRITRKCYHGDFPWSHTVDILCSSKPL
jgi:hypothetical protein